jgi:hypothetical protein
MPRLDAYGRWVSDDGALYWDGQAWQPMASITGFATYYPGTAAAARAPSRIKGGVALGFGIASLVLWLLPILGLPASITALIVGTMSLNTSGRKLGRWGLAFGVIGLVLTLINGALGAYFALRH